MSCFEGIDRKNFHTVSKCVSWHGSLFQGSWHHISVCQWKLCLAPGELWFISTWRLITGPVRFHTSCHFREALTCHRPSVKLWGSTEQKNRLFDSVQTDVVSTRWAAGLWVSKKISVFMVWTTLLLHVNLFILLWGETWYLVQWLEVIWRSKTRGTWTRTHVMFPLYKTNMSLCCRCQTQDSARWRSGKKFCEWQSLSFWCHDEWSSGPCSSGLTEAPVCNVVTWLFLMQRCLRAQRSHTLLTFNLYALYRTSPHSPSLLTVLHQAGSHQTVTHSVERGSDLMFPCSDKTVWQLQMNKFVLFFCYWKLGFFFSNFLLWCFHEEHFSAV